MKNIALDVSTPSEPMQCGDPTTAFTSRYAAARPLEFQPALSKRNHQVFRYPAKFHPPIAGKLIEMFSHPGDTVLDPFCGSGTLMVEAATVGRHSIGIDVDPLATMVAEAKTCACDLQAVETAAERFRLWLNGSAIVDAERYGSLQDDVDEACFKTGSRDLDAFIPHLPRLHHWFRRRVVLQLASIRREIEAESNEDAIRFLRLCFASIIRNSSNADPVPVSGLEVTSHMLAKEKLGRSIDPWTLMRRAIDRSLIATREFLAERARNVTCEVITGDARDIQASVDRKVDAVITSPPYLVAVDYYRRHTLEMYWLGLTSGRVDRLGLMTRYIGRDRVGLRNMPEEADHAKSVADRWLPRFAGVRPERERAFRHYCDGMARSLASMSQVVTPGGPIVIVAGDVRFCGERVSMLELMKDLAGDALSIADHLWYPIINRYMSYARHNDADIAADHVIVFRGTTTSKERG